MFSVIFDMDGTLLDTQRVCITAWDFGGEKQGIKNLGADIPCVCGMNEAGWTGYLRKKYPTLNMEMFLKDVRQYIVDNGVVRYKAGAEELISFLKENGIKIGLASGSSIETINHHLNIVGATDVFDAIAASKDVKNGKPAPDVFLLAAERMGVKAEDCFVLEDSPNGIVAGHAAGMKCIGIPDIAEFSKETRSLMYAHLNTLDEAIEIFRSLL